MVNIELSKELKKKYRHRIKHCYNNAKSLLNNKETEYMVIGYLYDDECKLYVRHAWGVKDNKIIDTSLNEWTTEKVEVLVYHPLFKINKIAEIIIKTSGPAALEMDPEKEYTFLMEKLRDINEVMKCAIQSKHYVLENYILSI